MEAYYYEKPIKMTIKEVVDSRKKIITRESPGDYDNWMDVVTSRILFRIESSQTGYYITLVKFMTPVYRLKEYPNAEPWDMYQYIGTFPDIDSFMNKEYPFEILGEWR